MASSFFRSDRSNVGKEQTGSVTPAPTLVPESDVPRNQVQPEIIERSTKPLPAETDRDSDQQHRCRPGTVWFAFF